MTTVWGIGALSLVIGHLSSVQPSDRRRYTLRGGLTERRLLCVIWQDVRVSQGRSSRPVPAILAGQRSRSREAGPADCQTWQLARRHAIFAGYAWKGWTFANQRWSDTSNTGGQAASRRACDRRSHPQFAEPQCDTNTASEGTIAMNAAQRTELFAMLDELARRYPEWRLGQLVANLADWADQAVWDVEDDRLLEAAKVHLAELASR